MHVLTFSSYVSVGKNDFVRELVVISSANYSPYIFSIRNLSIDVLTNNRCTRRYREFVLPTVQITFVPVWFG